MALFNRKNTDNSVLPEEVRDYYKSEQRTRTGRAWILAIITLLVTFLIAAALFFGGRWIYRTVFDNDNDKNTTSQTEQDAGEERGIDGDDTDESALPGNDTDNSSTESSTDQAGTGPATGTSSLNTDSPAVVPDTGPTELVNTGPGDE